MGVRLSFMQPDRLQQNMRAIVALGGLSPSDDLRRAYFDALNTFQREPVAYQADPPRPLVALMGDAETKALSHRVGATCGARPVDSAPPLDAQAAEAEHEARRRLVNQALDRLREYDVRSHAAVVDLVGILVMADTPGSASSSSRDRMGVVFMNPPDDWDEHDYAGTILHEAVHQALYLEEMTRRVFAVSPWEMEVDDLRVPSAIRKSKRSLDFAFHSACVSIEVAAYCESAGLPDRRAAITDRLPECARELELRRHAFTPLGAGLLDEVVRFTGPVASAPPAARSPA